MEELHYVIKIATLYFHIQVGDKKHGEYIAEKPPRNGFPKCGNFGW